jgi:mannose-6-phosphate isomerase-like protein (cupin superfamily)
MNPKTNLDFPTPHKVPKAWGYELWIHNDAEYCGKILHFEKGKKFSMHFHLKKKETWYVVSGIYRLKWIDTDNAAQREYVIGAGQIIEVPRGVPHQIECLVTGDVFEVSTEHFEDDSYRVAPGDSQNPDVATNTSMCFGGFPGAKVVSKEQSIITIPPQTSDGVPITVIPTPVLPESIKQALIEGVAKGNAALEKWENHRVDTCSPEFKEALKQFTK